MMQDLWNRLETWLNANAPHILATLQSGATEEEIKQAESFLSVQFPDDFKASYRIHNGQKNYPSYGLLNGREFLSLEPIQDEWTIWKDLLDGETFEGLNSEPIGQIKDDWWNPQ